MTGAVRSAVVVLSSSDDVVAKEFMVEDPYFPAGIPLERLPGYRRGAQEEPAAMYAADQAWRRACRVEVMGDLDTED
jgi:hypothetical protein